MDEGRAPSATHIVGLSNDIISTAHAAHATKNDRLGHRVAEAEP